MAISKCPKCEGSHFEVVENTPTKSKFILHFVQCATCGCVVGVVTDVKPAGRKGIKSQEPIEIRGTLHDKKGSMEVVNLPTDIIL